MEILRRIERNIQSLAASLQGLRVGLYPGSHGRFSGNLGALFSDLNMTALHHPDPRANHQGLPFIAETGAFLDAVDAVLLWGVDGGVAELLYRAQQRTQPPRILNLLDPTAETCILGPDSGLRFADLVEPGERDLTLLTSLGVDLDALAVSFQQRFRDEVNALAGKAGQPELSTLLENRLAAFELGLVEHRRALCACPFCGRVLASDQAFLLRQPELHFVTAHRFRCHEEFYLFKTTPILIGLYLPEREVFLNARPREESMRYMFYEAPNLTALIRRFKLLCLRHRDAVERYVAPQSAGKRPLALLGNFTNLGHQFRNELAAIQALLDAGRREFFDHTLVTLSDLFDISALFPELPPLHRLPRGDEERLTDAAFRLPLEKNLLPVLLHYGRDFQQALAERMQSLAAQRASERARQLAQACAKTPLSLWLTLRSTRAWISQTSGFIELLGRLRQAFPALVVVFDGLENERGRMEQIIAGLPGLPALDALGLNPVDTVHLAAHVTLHISPLGSGATFLGIVNVPGVFHGSREIMDAYLLPAGEGGQAGQGSVASLPREGAALNLPVYAVAEDASVEMHVRHYELAVDDLHQAVLAVLQHLGFAPVTKEGA